MELDQLPVDLLSHCLAQLPDARSLVRACAVSSRWRTLASNDMWKELCRARWEDWPPYRLSSEKERQLLAAGSIDWRERYRFVEADVRRSTITNEEMTSLPWFFNFTPQAGGRGRHTMKRAQFTPPPMSKLIVPGYPPLDWVLLPPPEMDVIDETDVSDPGAGAGAGAEGGLGSSSSSSNDGGSSADSPPTSTGASTSPRRSILAIRNLMSTLLSGVANAQVAAMDQPHPPDEPMRQAVQIANFPPHWVERLEDGEWLIWNDNVSFISCQGQEITYDQRGFLTEPTPL